MISSLEALAPWFSSDFLLYLARDSLNSSKDQLSDLLVILQLLKISLFVQLVFDKSGESSKRDFMHVFKHRSVLQM